LEHYVFTGECSTNRLLSGKHYNNGVRALKYLYNVFSQQRIDHLEQWLFENELPSLSNITTSSEFKEFIKDVSNSARTLTSDVLILQRRFTVLAS